MSIFYDRHAVRYTIQLEHISNECILISVLVFSLFFFWFFHHLCIVFISIYFAVRSFRLGGLDAALLNILLSFLYIYVS